MDYIHGFFETTQPNPQLLAEQPKLAFDVESTGLSFMKDSLLGVSFAVDRNDGYYFPMCHPYMPLDSLNDNRILKIAHNASFDRSFMKTAGCDVNNFADTAVAAHLLNENHLNLKHLASKHLGIHITSFNEIGGAKASVSSMGEMSSLHSAATYGLWEILEPKLGKWGLKHLFWDLQMPLVETLSDMEYNGVQIDLQELKVLEDEFSGKLRNIELAVKSLLGFEINLNSSDQVADLLFNKLKLKMKKKTGTGRGCTDSSVLADLINDHPVVGLISLHREYSKLMDTYIYGLMKSVINGRVHGRFSQIGTVTGRLSSSKPNLQNIPMRKLEGRRIRKVFVAPPGYVLVKADYSQVELRDLAIQSNDRYLVDAYLNERDIHCETAVRAYGDINCRRDAKTLNFKIVYGGGEESVRELFFGAYPEAGKWINETIEIDRENGYARTRHGRIRLIPEIQSSKRSLAAHGDREAISTHIQGSSAEEIMLGMNRLHKKIRGTEVKMVLQVHDEVVLQVPCDIVDDVVEVVRNSLEVYDYVIPLTVDIKVGENWRDCVDYGSRK